MMLHLGLYITGLESSEIVVSGRHVKYVIRFFNMWTNQILYIKEMLSSQGLQQGNPQGFINNSLYLPLGNIVIGED